MSTEYLVKDIGKRFDDDTDVHTVAEQLHTVALSKDEDSRQSPARSLGRGLKDEYTTEDRTAFDADQTGTGYSVEVDQDRAQVYMQDDRDGDADQYNIAAVERDDDGNVARMAVVGEDGTYTLERRQDGASISYESRRAVEEAGGGRLDEASPGFTDRAETLFRIADSWDRLDRVEADLPEPEFSYEPRSPREAFETAVDEGEYRKGPHGATVTLSDTAQDQLAEYAGSGSSEIGAGKTLQAISEDPEKTSKRLVSGDTRKATVRGTDQSDNMFYTLEEDESSAHVFLVGDHDDPTVNGN